MRRNKQLPPLIALVNRATPKQAKTRLRGVVYVIGRDSIEVRVLTSSKAIF